MRQPPSPPQKKSERITFRDITMLVARVIKSHLPEINFKTCRLAERIGRIKPARTSAARHEIV